MPTWTRWWKRMMSPTCSELNNKKNVKRKMYSVDKEFFRKELIKDSFDQVIMAND
jgi:hypothetical protein